MFGFASALIGEIGTGRGALGQLELETGLPPWGVDLLVLGIVAYSAIGALNPKNVHHAKTRTAKSPTFSEANQRDVKKRPSGGAPGAYSLGQTCANVSMRCSESLLSGWSWRVIMKVAKCFSVPQCPAWSRRDDCRLAEVGCIELHTLDMKRL